MAAARQLVVCCCLALALAPLGRTLIIPSELPTILSVLYSNIPPILKGTDSRLGLGFRFGPHADFQVMLELGPQQYTQQLGPDAGPDGKRRRQIPAPANGDSLGSRWLTAWRSGLVNPSQNILNTEVELPDPPSASDNAPEMETIEHLSQLYKSANTSAPEPEP